VAGPELGQAVDADIPRLLEIRHAAFSRHAPSAYSAEEVQTLLADVDELELREMISRHQLFVACCAGQVVGLAGWKGQRLRHVYVDPKQTRRGIATKLVGRAEADFREQTNAGQILAGVALHAELFYRRIGYDLVGRRRAWDGSEYLEMVKKL
jgi:GNAT superfamily N-acetyltransferase